MGDGGQPGSNQLLLSCGCLAVQKEVWSLRPVAPPALLAKHAGKLDFQRHLEPASATCSSLDNVEGSRVALPSWFPYLCLTGVCSAALLPELSIIPGKFSWAVFAAGPASVLQ